MFCAPPRLCSSSSLTDPVSRVLLSSRVSLERGRGAELKKLREVGGYREATAATAKWGKN